MLFRSKELLALVDHDLIFEGSTPESLAKGIEKFLTNPDYYSQLRLKCRETAERNYSWERVTDQTENVFKEIVFDNNA